jgi:N-acetylglucosamine kinase-like BadF-type ATPase
MRQQLTALAGGVARMAQSGDPDAQSIVDQFAKNGIKLAPPAQSTAPTPSK